jgi:hypothetical protein
MKLSAPQAKRAHSILALFIGVFIAVHFVTHLTTVAGIEAHTRAFGWARLVYQAPLVEITLVLALAAQVVLGIILLRAIAKRPHKDRWHWLQFLSGAYLVLFITNHTAAAIITRLAVGLDTNFYWAAGTLVLTPLKYGFAPYYLLAVIAIISHLIAALHFRGSRRWHGPALAVGPLLGVIFIAGYGGAFDTVDLPQEYLEYFDFYPGVTI